VGHLIMRSLGSISFRKPQPRAGFFGNLETAVFEWDIHKHPSEVYQDLKKRAGKTKESGRELVVQWVSHKICRLWCRTRSRVSLFSEIFDRP
jgi:hypothetical protein